MPCGYAVDEVPAKRIVDCIVPCQVEQGTAPVSYLLYFRFKGNVESKPVFFNGLPKQLANTLLA